MKQTKRNKVKIVEIHRVKLGPGDILVVKSSGILSEAAKEGIYRTAKGVFGTEAKVLVLEPGFALEVVEITPGVVVPRTAPVPDTGGQVIGSQIIKEGGGKEFIIDCPGYYAATYVRFSITAANSITCKNGGLVDQEFMKEISKDVFTLLDQKLNKRMRTLLARRSKTQR